MIGALFRRLRARKARRQARWMTGYVRARYGDGTREQQALDAWSRVKP